jgi:uncharacterized membrane protein
MFGLEILETAIGLVFVYALLSVVCSSAREAIEGILKSRARNLEGGIEQLVGPELAARIYQHPMVFGLFKGGYTPSAGRSYGPKSLLLRRRLPSYIPARNFALAFYDLSIQASREARRDALSGGDDGSGDANGSKTPNGPGKTATGAAAATLAGRNARQILPLVLGTTADGAEPVLREIEGWYNASMDRISGWYKRNSQFWILLFAAVFTIALDVNTLTIAGHLYRDDAHRALVMARVEGRAGAPRDAAEASKQLAELDLPILGTAKGGATGWPEDVAGWLLTILAVLLGAPFWFDVLNKLMVIRSTVKPHEKSREEGSEDRPSRSRSEGAGGGHTWTPLPLALGSVPADTDVPGPPGEESPGTLQFRRGSGMIIGCPESASDEIVSRSSGPSWYR